MTKRKIEAMRATYGADDDHKCGECSNFVRGRYHNRILQKCGGYGLTHSAASDWAKSYPACGMFNKDFGGARPLIGRLERTRDNAPLDGQLDLFGDERLI